MLLETLHYAIAMAMSERKRPDEIRDAISLWSRAQRCRHIWHAHELNCRHFLEHHLDGLEQKRSVAVLGSGIGRDVPIGTLAKAFDKVYLYDLVHLPSIRMRARWRGWRNIEFIEMDLVDDPEFNFLRDHGNIDLVISANVLSQMVLDLSENGYPEKAEGLARAHLAHLFMGQWTGCLLSDVSFETHFKNGRSFEHGDLLAGVEPPPADESWDWTVVPFGEVDENHETVHKVIAVWK